MANEPTIAVIGGDTRQIYAADRLKKYGYPVLLAGFEHFDTAIKPAGDAALPEALKAPVLLLPLPFSRNGKTVTAPYCRGEIPIRTVADGLAPEQRVFVGGADDKTAARLAASGARVTDYFKNETLTLFNAMLTAEGLFGMIVEKLPCAVYGSEAAIAGYGRIGFYLARLLQAAGAEVTVFARSPAARAKARTLGLCARDTACLGREQFRFDYLVNTAPAKLLRTEALRRLNPGCVLFEAASAPFGIDFETADAMGFAVYKAQSLPGKTAPKSAGCIIAETVRDLLTGVNT